MKRVTFAAAAVAAATALCGVVLAQSDAAGDVAAGAQSAQIERGRYLVHEASMCVQCHSPRDRQGDLDESRLLTGGAIPFKAPWPGAQRWAFQAPNLRNALGYTEQEWVTFLTTGVRPSGDMPRPPMPPYRMTADDAQAIYAYLQSL